MFFVGDDWAEEHHDVELQDQTGQVLGRAKLPEGIAGITRLHTMIGEHLGPDGEPVQVVVGIETDRGPWVQALTAAGYQIYDGPRAFRTRGQMTISRSGLFFRPLVQDFHGRTVADTG